MEAVYSRWGVMNSSGKFLSRDDEGFYYYQLLDAEFLFPKKQHAEVLLNRAKESLKDLEKGEKMNMYSDCRYDPDMKIVEVEVKLKLKV